MNKIIAVAILFRTFLWTRGARPQKCPRPNRSGGCYTYRPAEPGDEHSISACIGAAADLSEMTEGTPEGMAEWKQICAVEELRERILSDEKALVAIQNGMIVGFIAFRKRNHLSLLFVRREFAGRGIGRELFTQCANDLEEITVNASDLAVGFYQKVGFEKSGDRFFKNGAWATPMRWTNHCIH
jgi:putative acetyltransferase